MAQVTVRVGGYSHPVACQDGQERHLTNMATEVDKRIGTLKAMGMQFGETRMLLLAALQLADEAADLQAEVAALKAGGAVAATPVPAEPDPELIARLNGLAETIEAIAAGLERT
ncbi:cell division protein ZapA [Roseomonas terrae]|jgi:cell division protein ZapA|uniref:Cell division protein ZapA n=1 Tax=Neoroseomonas terrae TaxID=424799 RepID=A0ABS5EMW2_9PROT|nr:cell division protein ZapA [Neoroseomonas terrae]MBR0652363.1 cell division protein ZapA [Neoroseomonas terrae]